MPKIERFEPYEIEGKSWGEEYVIAHTDTYLGKLLLMREGGSGHLQSHADKDETFYLYAGQALVEYADENGDLHTTIMEPGESYHVPCGAVHRVEALEPCVFFETSLPVFDDRVIVREHVTATD